MFFCNDCADERKWPKSLFRSLGRCEICGKTRECSDVPSSSLPPAPAYNRTTVRKQVCDLEVGDEFFMNARAWRVSYKGEGHVEARDTQFSTPKFFARFPIGEQRPWDTEVEVLVRDAKQIEGHVGPARRTIEEDFWAFHRANPQVYDRLSALAGQLKDRGHTKVGIGMLFEVLRWEHMMSTSDVTPFKLNNNYRAYYARLIMHRRPSLAGFFDLRKQREGFEFDPSKEDR